MKIPLTILLALVFLQTYAQEKITYESQKEKLYKKLNEKYIGPFYQAEIDHFYKVACDSLVSTGLTLDGEQASSLLVKLFLATEIELEKKTISKLRVPSLNDAFLQTLKIYKKGSLKELYSNLGINRMRILYATFKDIPAGDTINTFASLREMTYNPILIPGRINKPELAPWKDTMVYYLANFEPEFFLTELKNNSTLQEVAANHSNPTVKAVLALKDEENITELLPFGLAIFEKRMTIEAVRALINKPAAYYSAYTKEMLLLHSSQEPYKQKYLSVYRQDLNDVISEYYVTPMNEMHEKPDAQRYRILTGTSAQDLYFVILGGGSSFYTSSFLHTFDQFLKAAEKEGLSAFFERIGYFDLGEFLTTISGYGVLNKLAGQMDEQRFTSALINYMNTVVNSQMTDRELILHGMNLAEIFNGLKVNEKIRVLLISRINEIYASRKTSNVMLGRMYAGFIDILENNQNGKLAEVEKLYETLAVDKLKSRDTIIQVALFYDDVDGTASYANFMEIFNNKEWNKEDRGNYLIMQSKSGNPMIVYCNKPNTKIKDNAAQNEMLLAVSEAGREITSFLHRGHSHHLFKSLRKLPATAQFVYLGSCGGYNDVSKVFFANPDAHIISTRSIGSKYVNDPILKKYTSEVLANHDLNWVALWKGFETSFTNKNTKDLFSGYIPPNKYVGIMFIREVFNY
jgi:hypothetical protein